MSAAYLIGVTTIARVWEALGGPKPKHNRAPAFYRDGDNRQAVSLDDEKACWYDFVTGEGGGMLDLIQRVLGCNRGAALRWLSDFTGIPLESRQFTVAERRRYGREHAKADGLAQDVADFVSGLDLFWLRRCNLFAALNEWILNLGIETSELLLGDSRDLAMLRHADPDSVVATYRELPESVRGHFRDEGRSDREHAEMVTRAIIDMLARADAKAAA